MLFKNLLISIPLLLLSYLSHGQSAGIQENRATHPVSTLYLSTIEAFNEGNLELFLSNFSSDATMYGTDGMYKGKAALRNRFKVIFEQFPNKKMEIPKLELDIISKKTVLVHFTWKLYPMGAGPAYEGIGSGLYVVKDDAWTEVLEIETVTKVDEALRQK